jgi:hypothetical protein
MLSNQFFFQTTESADYVMITRKGNTLEFEGGSFVTKGWLSKLIGNCRMEVNYPQETQAIAALKDWENFIPLAASKGTIPC